MDDLKNNDAYIFISSHGCLKFKDNEYDIIDLNQINTNINVNMVTLGELGTLTPFCNFYSEFVKQFNSFDTNHSFIQMVDFYLDNYMRNNHGYNYANKIHKSHSFPWIYYKNESELNQKYQKEYNEILKQSSNEEIQKNIDLLNSRVAENKVGFKRKYEGPSQIDTIFCRVFTYSKNNTIILDAKTDNRMQMPNDEIIRTQIDFYKNKFIDRILSFSSKLGSITLMKYNGDDKELISLKHSNIFDTIRRMTYHDSNQQDILLSQIIEYFNNKGCNVNIILATCMCYPDHLDVHQRLTLKRSYHNDAWGGRQKKQKQKYKRKSKKQKQKRRIKINTLNKLFF
jgi:hypothetical protein